MDTEDNGFAAGLSNAICKDGQQTTTARIPFAVGLSVNQGTVTTPSISVAADTGTGLYQTTAGEMRFASNGAYAATLNANGLDNTVVGAGTSANGTFTNVGIGGAAGTGAYNLYVIGNNPAYFATTGAADAAVVIDDKTGGQQAYLGLYDNGTFIWAVEKAADNSFFLYDHVNAVTFLHAIRGGNLVLGPAQNFSLAPATGNVGIGASPTTYQLTVKQTGTSQGFFGSLGANNCQVYIDSNNAANNSNLVFSTGGTGKWQTYLEGSTGYWRLYDIANSKAFIAALPGGALTLGANANVTIDQTGLVSFGTASVSTTGYYTTVQKVKRQWGVGTVAGNSTLTVTFPSAFSTACYGIQLTVQTSQTVTAVVPPGTSAPSGSTTSFTAYNANSFSVTFSWEAIGV